MIPFQDYLEAKIALDARSRNQEVYAAFLEALRTMRHGASLRILDVGCGTGAMLRRLFEEDLAADLDLTALDRDAASLRLARLRLLAEVRAAGLACEEGQDTLAVSRRGNHAVVRFVQGDVLEDAWESGTGEPYDVVMAHAFMDIVPLDRTLALFRRLLAAQGLLYTTITYDGRTTVVPAARDSCFEARLLEVYDRSMDQRRTGGGAGGAGGGSRSGTLLLAALAAADFGVVGCGASDWSLYPFGGRYRGAESVFLEAILETIQAEGLRQGLPHAAMDRWMESRMDDLRAARLGLIVHQLDILARMHEQSASQ